MKSAARNSQREFLFVFDGRCNEAKEAGEGLDPQSSAYTGNADSKAAMSADEARDALLSELKEFGF